MFTLKQETLRTRDQLLRVRSEAVKTTEVLWQLSSPRNGTLEHLSVWVRVHVRGREGGSNARWKEVCFFLFVFFFFSHPVGPQTGAGWGGALGGTAWGGLCWTRCTVTELRAGGHGVQHSYRTLSVYTTAIVPGGRWQRCITAPSDNTYCLYFLFNIYQEDKKPMFIVSHVEDVRTLKTQ